MSATKGERARGLAAQEMLDKLIAGAVEMASDQNGLRHPTMLMTTAICEALDKAWVVAPKALSTREVALARMDGIKSILVCMHETPIFRLWKDTLDHAYNIMTAYCAADIQAQGHKVALTAEQLHYYFKTAEDE